MRRSSPSFGSDIYSKDLASGTVSLLAHSTSDYGGLALDAERGKLYFGDLNGLNGAVRRMNTDGSSVELVIPFLPSAGSPFAIVPCPL